MKRLHCLNLFGVIVLGALCIVQWRHDRRLNLQLNQIEKTRLEQAAKISELEQNLRGVNADLTQFKEQFTKTQSELAEALQKLRASDRLTNQLAVERDQLKSSITNWVAAVATRDERLKESNAEIKHLADELNAAVRKFNNLATNYNATVKDLNDLRTRISQSQTANPAQPPRKPE